MGSCRVITCRGNGILRTPGGGYSLFIPHHKTSDHSSQRDQAPITYPFPPSMLIWMDVWFSHCYGVIAAEVRGGGARARAVPRSWCPSEPAALGVCAGHQDSLLHLGWWCPHELLLSHQDLQGGWVRCGTGGGTGAAPASPLASLPLHAQA